MPVERNPMYDVAVTRLDAGLSIVPIAPEMKAPSVVDDRTRQSVEITWTRWQSQYVKPGTLRNWFPRGQLMGIGIVCGAISGLAIDGTTYGLEVLDIDAGDTLIAFESQLAATGYLNLLERLPKERTPGGGAHFPYRCDVFQGNQVLARRRLGVDEQDHVVIKTLIETRGTGGQVVAAPTPPGIHPSHPELGYTLERGSWESIPIISPEARELLFACARSLNEYVPKNDYPDRGVAEYSNDSPGNDYSARVTDEEVIELLGKHGWAYPLSSNGVVYLTRPGKDAKEGHSATFGKVGPKVLYVFSSNAHPFQGAHDDKQGTPYDPFGIYARLEHGGDFHAAALALKEQGYGPAQDVTFTSGELSGVDCTLNTLIAPPTFDWPVMGEPAFSGPAGEFVRLISPHSEADPVALLLEFLLTFGNIIGRQPHCAAEADYHAFNENVVLVGTTAKGRKGSSWGHVRRFFTRIDERWGTACIQAGLSSGEGLVWAVRDPTIKRDRDGGLTTADEGASDKRLLVVEQEFASILRVVSRDGNTLSAMLRQAWDTGELRTLTKNAPAKATGAHISVIGHITRDELLRHLSNTEAGNGFGNRFLWSCVRRSRELPHGSRMVDGSLDALLMTMQRVVRAAQKQYELTRNAEADQRWEEVYHVLSEGQPGLLGAMLARAEAHVLRLSGTYALLDESRVITRAHLDAALAVWAYCEASTRYIFGASLGDPTADEVLGMLREVYPAGLTRTDLYNAFGRHKASIEITRALGKLAELALVKREVEDTGGRPSERWFSTNGGAQ